jgi:DNA polymerase/3'-5' exonuclease PolX
MSEGARLPLAEASTIAEELVTLLEPATERLTVCGSIRRRAQTVGDIDLVTIAKWSPVKGLFGDADGSVNDLNFLLDELCGQQVIHQARKSNGHLAGWGPTSRKFTFRGLQVQCQQAEPDTFGMWVLIRTGPAYYVHAFVTPRGQKAWIRDREGNVTGYRPGMLPPGFSIPKDSGFRLHRAHQFVPTPTEASVYEALGRPYLPPEHRR